MSDVFDITDDGDVDLIAAEYVLGTLDLSERTTFAQRLRQDISARRAVARWELRFAELAETLEAGVPSSQVWDAIERALRSEHLKVIDGGRIAAPQPLPNLRASRNRWRTAAILSGSVAAALAMFVVGSRIGLFETPYGSSGESYVAAINRGGDKPALIVRVDLRTRTVAVRTVAAETPAGHSLELWYIDPGQAPRSMGLVDKVSETLPVPTDAKGGAATFAVSVEPPGGSKTGGPTGPVVYSGQLVKE